MPSETKYVLGEMPKCIDDVYKRPQMPQQTYQQQQELRQPQNAQMAQQQK